MTYYYIAWVFNAKSLLKYLCGFPLGWSTLSTPNTGLEIIIFDSGAYFCMNDFTSLTALNTSLGVACGTSLVPVGRTFLSGLFLKCSIIKNFNIIISAMVVSGNVRIFMDFRFDILHSLRPDRIESPIIKVVPFFHELI